MTGVNQKARVSFVSTIQIGLWMDTIAGFKVQKYRAEMYVMVFPYNYDDIISSRVHPSAVCCVIFYNNHLVYLVIQ